MTGLRRRLAAAQRRLENVVLVGLLLAMMGLAVLQIILRNGFETGIPWLAPLLRILVLWIAMLGGIVASRDRRHISSDLLGRFLPSGIRRFSDTAACLCAVAVCALVAWHSLQFVRMEYEAPSMAFAHVPTWVCESIIPFTFAVMALHYAGHAWDSLRGVEPPAHREGML